MFQHNIEAFINLYSLNIHGIEISIRRRWARASRRCRLAAPEATGTTTTTAEAATATTMEKPRPQTN